MDKFEVLDIIGQGTFGTVYKAKEISTENIFALKIMKNSFNSWNECERLREVNFLKKFEHENIVKLYEVIKDNDKLILVFEYMEMNLYELIKQHISSNKKINEKTIKVIIKQILKALAYMEEQGYFHRDLKPENILITGTTVKVADFGLVKEINSQPPFSDYISTRWYRAPECLLNSLIYDSSIDVWAVGLIMTELYNLKPLFPGSNEIDQLSKIFKVLGYPSFFHWPEGVILAKKLNFKLQNNINSVIFLERLLPDISREGLNLIEDMLNLDPNCRPKACNLLKHHYFKDKIDRVLSADPKINSASNTMTNSMLNANLTNSVITLTAKSIMSNKPNMNTGMTGNRKLNMNNIANLTNMTNIANMTNLSNYKSYKSNDSKVKYLEMSFCQEESSHSSDFNKTKINHKNNLNNINNSNNINKNSMSRNRLINNKVNDKKSNKINNMILKKSSTNKKNIDLSKIVYNNELSKDNDNLIKIKTNDSQEYSTSFLKSNYQSLLLNDNVNLLQPSPRTPCFSKKKSIFYFVNLKDKENKREHHGINEIKTSKAKNNQTDLSTHLPLLNFNSNSNYINNINEHNKNNTGVINPTGREKMKSFSKKLNISPIFEKFEKNSKEFSKEFHKDYTTNPEQRNVFPKPKLLIPKHNHNNSSNKNSKEKSLKNQIPFPLPIPMNINQINNINLSPKYTKERNLFEMKLNHEYSNKYLNIDNYTTSINSTTNVSKIKMANNIVMLPIINSNNPSSNNVVPQKFKLLKVKSKENCHKDIYKNDTQVINVSNYGTYNLRNINKLSKLNEVSKNKDSKEKDSKDKEKDNTENKDFKDIRDNKEKKKRHISALRFLDNSFLDLDNNKNDKLLERKADKVDKLSDNNLLEKSTDKYEKTQGKYEKTQEKHEKHEKPEKLELRNHSLEKLFENESNLKKEAMAIFKDMKNNKINKGKKLINNLNINLLKFQKIELNGL